MALMLMYYSYLIPSWFFGFDIGMEVLFFLITLLVALFAFKISKITKERNIKFFGIAFLLISISYVVSAANNFWFVVQISNSFRELDLQHIAFLGILINYVYIVLFIAGLVTLAFITCNSAKWSKTYYLLLGLSLLVIASSMSPITSFRIVSLFLIFFIGYYYLEEYFENGNKHTLGTFFAFLLLFLAELDFVFVPVYYQAYIVGYLLELAAYLTLLGVLIKSVKK